MQVPVDRGAHIPYTGLAFSCVSQTKNKANGEVWKPFQAPNLAYFIWACFATDPRSLVYLPRRICHAPPASKVSEVAFGEAISNSAASVEPCARAPPSLQGACANLLSVRAFIAKAACQKPFWGRVHRSGCCHHCAGPTCRWASQPTRAVNSPALLFSCQELSRSFASHYIGSGKAKLCSF